MSKLDHKVTKNQRGTNQTNIKKKVLNGENSSRKFWDLTKQGVAKHSWEKKHIFAAKEQK